MIKKIKKRIEEFKQKGKKKKENKNIGKTINVDPREIKLHPQISKMFEIDDEILKEIIESMKSTGFDRSQSLVVFYINNELYLAEGHTRRKASIEANIDKVPVYIEDFTEEEALNYCYKRQFQRRQTTQGQLLKAVMNIELKTNRDGSGRSSDILSKKYKVSTGTIINARFVAKNASKADLKAIEEGKTTINKIFQKIKNIEKQKKEDETKKEIILDPEKINIASKSDEQINNDTNNKHSKNRKATIEEDNIKRQSIWKSTDNKLAEDILKILIDEKEEKAVTLIISKYRNSFSESFLKEISF